MNLQAKSPSVEAVISNQQFCWTREDGLLGIKMNPLRPALAHEVMSHPWFRPVLEYILVRLGDTCHDVFAGKVERTALGIEEWTCFLTVLDVQEEIKVDAKTAVKGYLLTEYLEKFMDCMERYGRVAGMRTDDEGNVAPAGDPMFWIKENGAISSADTLPIETLWLVRARDRAVLDDRVICTHPTGYQLMPSWSMRVTVRHFMRNQA
jgi:hypothetical protein